MTAPAQAVVTRGSGCYLLHFEPRYKHAGHYLGWAEDIGRRVYDHEMGQSGVPLTTAAARAGVSMTLARTWPGLDRDGERKLKGFRNTGRKGGLRRLCPICKAQKGAPQ